MINNFVSKIIGNRFFSITVAVCAGFSILAGVVFYVFYLQDAVNLPEPWFDDAFMYIRYAKNIVAGYGCCWNIDAPPAYGGTDLVYTYLLAAIKLVCPSVSYEKMAVLMPVINYGAVIGLCVFFLIRYCSRRTLLSAVTIAALVAGPLLLNHDIAYHLFTGMDTIISFSANCALIICFLIMYRRPAVSWAVVAAFAAYFSWLVRPDNFFYATLFPFLFLLFNIPGRKGVVAAYYLCFGALMLFDIVWKHFYFGTFLPLPFYVKSNGFFTGYMGEPDWNPWQYTLLFLKCSLPWLILMVLFFERRKINWYVIFLLPVYATVCYFLTAVQIMGASARYYIPSIPFLIFLSIISGFDTKENPLPLADRFTAQRIFLSSGIIVILILAFNVWGDKSANWFEQKFLRRESPFIYSKELKSNLLFPAFTDENSDFNELCKQLPRNTLVAAGEHGRLAGLNEHIRVLDLYGLHEPYFAYNGFSADYLLKMRPSIIQMAHYNYTKINYDLVTNSSFQQQYYFFPNMFSQGVAVLKSDTITYKIFRNEVKRLYGFDDPLIFMATIQQK